MTFPDQFRTAFSNVGRHKMRSTLASLGVVVGTLTIVILVSLASGVRQQINRQFASVGMDRLTVTPYGGIGGFGPGGGRGFGPGRFNPVGPVARKKIITAQDVERWKHLSGVTQTIPEINLPGSVDLELKWNGTNQAVRLATAEAGSVVLFEEPPAPLAGSLELPDSGGLVLSQATAQALGVASNGFAGFIGQSVDAVLRTSRGETRSFPLRVQGITQERNHNIQVSVADRIAMKGWWFNSTNTLESEGYNYVTIRSADVSRATELSVQIQQEGFQVQSLEAFVKIANHVVTVITVMFTLVGGIALLVATIGITNTMVMAIYERTREIGILKAMGASSGEIRQMFMMEAGCIGLIGGLIGLLLGWLAGLGLNQAIKVYFIFRDLPMRGSFFVVTLTLALGVIVFATLIGLAAGLLPAQRAATLDPLQALRHE